MLNSIHFLLTLSCNFECDHCFLYCGPQATGTFTIAQIRDVIEEAKKLGTIESVYFEGGEPFLYYPLLLEAVKIASDAGLKTGIVTNCYWATSGEDAELWLKPLAILGVDDFCASDDSFHHSEENNPVKNVYLAAKKLGMPVGSICIEKPTVDSDSSREKGAAVIDGGAQFKGRAVEKLTEGLPTVSCGQFTECPAEDFQNPGRIHLDSFGNVHLCQGIVMDNAWETPFSELIQNYDPDSHPIVGPLLKGGPLELAREYKVVHDDEYISACHFCYKVRSALLGRFPKYLTPRQVYGLE